MFLKHDALAARKPFIHFITSILYKKFHEKPPRKFFPSQISLNKFSQVSRRVCNYPNTVICRMECPFCATLPIHHVHIYTYTSDLVLRISACMYVYMYVCMCARLCSGASRTRPRLERRTSRKSRASQIADVQLLETGFGLPRGATHPQLK